MTTKAPTKPTQADPIAQLAELKREAGNVRATIIRTAAEMNAARIELVDLSIARRSAFEERARGVPGSSEKVTKLEQRTVEVARAQERAAQENAGAAAAEKEVTRQVRVLYGQHADAFIAQAEDASEQAATAIRRLGPELTKAYDLWQQAALLWQPLCEEHGFSIVPRCPLPHKSELAGKTPRPTDMSGRSAGLQLDPT